MNSESKSTDSCGRQGDILFRRIATLPEDAVLVARGGSDIVIAHSETGHHHVIAAASDVIHFEAPNDPFICYLQMGDSGFVDIAHRRTWDTHGTMTLLGGSGALWEGRRQKQSVNGVWKRAAD